MSYQKEINKTGLTAYIALIISAFCFFLIELSIASTLLFFVSCLFIGSWAQDKQEEIRKKYRRVGGE